MKNRTIIINMLIVTAILLGYTLFFQTGDQETGYSVPCSEPLELRVGSLDDRFQMDRATLEEALREVADLWSSSMGEPVVVYSDDAELLVDLVYAEEQQLTDSERQFRDRLQSEGLSIEVMERRFNEREAEYESRAREYEEKTAELQISIDRLNQWVNIHNRNGGFNEDELRQYEYRKASIDKTSQALDRQQAVLMEDAETLNRMISDLNRRIANKNELVDEYNRTFTGERKFTQGAYEWNQTGKSIQVFQFSSMEELKLVLAHEVGHALGLPHVDNPSSVMYYLMGNQKVNGLALTTEDIQALKALCSGQGEAEE
jgi:hypothetical protein